MSAESMSATAPKKHTPVAADAPKPFAKGKLPWPLAAGVAIAFTLMFTLAFSWQSALQATDPYLASWFIVESCLLLGVMASWVAGRHAAGDGVQLWFIRPNCRLAAMAFDITWAVILPAAICWLVLGARWYAHAVETMPERVPDVWAVVIPAVQIVFGTVTFGYALFAANIVWYRRSVSKSAGTLQRIVDDDLLTRWGQPAPRLETEYRGVPPDDLALLHIGTWEAAHEEDDEETNEATPCAICFDTLNAGDPYRRLQCDHVFHRPCADLWLLRKPTCPLCFAHVGGACTPCGKAQTVDASLRLRRAHVSVE